MSDNTEIKLSSEHFEACYTELNNLHQMLLDQREKYLPAKSILLRNWKGQAYSPADEHTEQLDLNLRRTINGLYTLKESMKSIYKNFSETDQDMAQSVATK